MVFITLYYQKNIRSHAPWSAGSPSEVSRKPTQRTHLMVAGMTRIALYPLAAARNASAIPVLPDVGSTNVVTPGVITPAASAASIMLFPIRSFTLEQGSMDSSLAATIAPPSGITFFMYTIGVLPIRSVTLSTIPTMMTTGGKEEAVMVERASSCASRRWLEEDKANVQPWPPLSSDGWSWKAFRYIRRYRYRYLQPLTQRKCSPGLPGFEPRHWR